MKKDKNRILVIPFIFVGLLFEPSWYGPTPVPSTISVPAGKTPYVNPPSFVYVQSTFDVIEVSPAWLSHVITFSNRVSASEPVSVDTYSIIILSSLD